jgi:hypothetical protein
MLKLTTTVYKYKRYAQWMLIGVVVVTLFLFVGSPILPPPINAVGIISIFILAIYAAVKPKSVFSLRSVDERKLAFTEDALQWGNWLIAIHELEKLDIYLHGFDTFRYLTGHAQGRKTFTTVYGDRNTISFTYRSMSYDLTFYLGTFEHYDMLIRIMQQWREKGIIFSCRSLFTDEYIREQVQEYSNYP